LARRNPSGSIEFRFSDAKTAHQKVDLPRVFVVRKPDPLPHFDPIFPQIGQFSLSYGAIRHAY
jgi:hypothetical protein